MVEMLASLTAGTAGTSLTKEWRPRSRWRNSGQQWHDKRLVSKTSCR